MTQAALLSTVRTRLWNNRWRGTLGLVGLGGCAYLYNEYRTLKELQKIETCQESPKLALTIDFDRLELVQTSSPNEYFRKRFVRKFLQRQFDNDGAAAANETHTYSIQELVHLIHSAAQDPQVCALFGNFGGSGPSKIGLDRWADLEEVRNALIVFSQSHRRHYEPNQGQKRQVTQPSSEDATDPVCPLVQPKSLYCFANNFGFNPGNPDYYLASAFSHVHLQPLGELQLFGLLSTNFFLREFLERHGILLHVVKHGDYKTAPNTFTENNFTRAHKESTFNLVAELDADLCLDITQSRSKPLLTAWLKHNPAGANAATAAKVLVDNSKILDLWQIIHESGTFPAPTALKAGLVDFVPRRNPLPDLLAYNQAKERGQDERAESIKARWQTNETDFEHFKATKSVSLEDYELRLEKIKKLKSKRDRWAHFLRKVCGQKMIPAIILPKNQAKGQLSSEKEQVLTLDVVGLIDDAKAREVVAKLRALRETNNKLNEKKEKPKAIVMRVASRGGTIFACEQISQELRALDIPLVVSFGHVAASGGYYISAFADRIFGSNKTLTGSVGVFGMRADLTGLAHKYGVSVEHVAAGNLAATYSVFAPMTRPMFKNMTDSVDRWYLQFKNVVREGRGIENVEQLAQGKIWTGRQAKGVGLLDEIGGYERALAYAKRTYCKNPEQVEVVKLGESKSMWGKFKEYWTERDRTRIWQDVQYFWMDEKQDWNSPDLALGEWLLRSGDVMPNSMSGIYMTADETTAIQALLMDSFQHHQSGNSRPV